MLINLNEKNIEGKHFIISVETFLMSHAFDMSCFFCLQFVFMHVRIVAKSACQRCNVRLSSYISADPSGRIRVKLDTGDFHDTCRTVEKFHIWLKPGKKHWEVYMKT